MFRGLVQSIRKTHQLLWNTVNLQTSAPHPPKLMEEVPVAVMELSHIQLRSESNTAPKTMKRTKRANDFFTFRFA